MKYDKLVRDRIPEIIKLQGKNVTYRILSEEEYREYLEKKLDEEVAEFHESKSIEELADILEVIEALSGYDSAYLAFKKNEKHYTRGGFKKRICLLEVEEGRLHIEPCKCGYAPEIIKIYPKFFLRCSDCGRETKLYATKQTAIKAWNSGKFEPDGYTVHTHINDE